MIGTLTFLVFQFPFEDIHELNTFMKYQGKFFRLLRQGNQVRFKFYVGVECVAKQLIPVPDKIVMPLYYQALTGLDKSRFMALTYILEQVGQ